MKKGGGSKKGSTYEREICTQFSMWWCGLDDTLWRTGGSGGRATVRGRKGKTTLGGCGDVCSTDPISKPLMDYMTLELKCGYSKVSPFDILDKKSHAKKQQWEQWVEQAMLSRKNAKSRFWAIVAKRNQRDSIMMMPYVMFEELGLVGMTSTASMDILIKTGLHKSKFISVGIIRLDQFFKTVKPTDIGE